MADFSLPAVAGRISSGKLLLGDLKPAAKALETVAEWDVTPGLHEWIEEEIDRREEVARDHQQACGSWEYDSFVHQIRDHCNAGEVADVPREGTGRFIEVNDPDDVLRRCAADRKILSAHERIPHDPRHSNGIDFGCGTCHTDGDGCDYAGGNCTTILALAEAYGLEPAGDADVEVVRD